MSIQGLVQGLCRIQQALGSPLGDLYIVFFSISRLNQGSGKLSVGLIGHFIGEYGLHFGM